MGGIYIYDIGILQGLYIYRVDIGVSREVVKLQRIRVAWRKVGALKVAYKGGYGV